MDFKYFFFQTQTTALLKYFHQVMKKNNILYYSFSLNLVLLSVSKILYNVFNQCLAKNQSVLLKQLILFVSGKLMQVIFGHWDVVTCLARSESYIGGNCYILSGSRDATLLLWYWNGKTNIVGDNPRGKKNPFHNEVV